jgi:hypothetical protein
VFGSVAFHAREEVWMPPPGQTLPARFHVHMRDLVWDAVYAPVESAVSWAADRLNKVQSWTIRAYLTLVFGAVVVLLTVLAVWQ